MRRFLHVDNIVITLLVFLVIGALFIAPVKIKFLQPFAMALGDFDVTDLEFSQLRDQEAIPADTNIVIVNIGTLSRGGVAREIEAISRNNPKVIGIDAFFRHPKAPDLDSTLARALAGAHSVVLASELISFNQDSTRWDSLSVSLPEFNQYATLAYANLVTDSANAFRTARLFSPKEQVGDSTAWSFSAKILQLYDSAAFHDLASRGKPTEIINYRGNGDKFYMLDATDVLDSNQDLSFLQNKIVLMGFLGPTIGSASLEDVFFTPLNARYAGKTFPDMHGVAVHANIISMGLHRDYIGTMPTWLGIVLALLLCHLHTVLFSWINVRFERWFDAITTGIQLLETIGVLFLIVVVFEIFKFRLNITLALVAMVLCGNMFEVYHSLLHTTWLATKEKFMHVIIPHK